MKTPINIVLKLALGVAIMRPECPAQTETATLAGSSAAAICDAVDSESPEFSLKFYEDARVKSPDIRRGSMDNGRIWER